MHYMYHILLVQETCKRSMNENIYLKLRDGVGPLPLLHMDLRLVLGQCPSLIIIEQFLWVKILFLVLPLIQLLLDQLLRCLKELSLVKLRQLVELVRWSHIMIVILKLEKHLSMGLGTLTLKDQQIAMSMVLGIDMVLVLVPNS